MKVGMAQLLVEGGEPDRNLERAATMVAEAAGEGCDMVLLPECLDLAWTHPSALNEAEPIPGPRSDAIGVMARDNGIWVCAGLTERDGDKVYNTAVLVDDEGGLRLKYRKINVLTVAQDIYAIGRSLSVVETPFGLIGVNICSDNYGDALEIGHTLARMGAQVILSPSSWTVDYSVTEEDDPYGEKWFGPYHTLARLHDVVIVNATSVGMIVGGVYEGKKMVGCSMAVNKDGVIAQGTQNEFSSDLAIAEFDVPAPRQLGTAVGERLKAAGHHG